MSTGRVGVRGGGRSIIDRSLSYSSSPRALLRSTVSSVTLPSSSYLPPTTFQQIWIASHFIFLRVNQFWSWHCDCNGIQIIGSKCGIKRKLEAPATWWKLVRKREIVVERIKLLMLLPNSCWGNIWQLVQAFYSHWQKWQHATENCMKEMIFFCGGKNTLAWKSVARWCLYACAAYGRVCQKVKEPASQDKRLGLQ